MPITKERMLAVLDEANAIHEAHEELRVALRIMLEELESQNDKANLARILAENEIPLPLKIMEETLHFQKTLKESERAKAGMRRLRMNANILEGRIIHPRPLAQARNAAARIARLAPDIATSTPEGELVIHDEGRTITIEPDEDALTPDKIEEGGLDL